MRSNNIGRNIKLVLIIIGLLALVLIPLLSGCGQKEKEEKPIEEQEVEQANAENNQAKGHALLSVTLAKDVASSTATAQANAAANAAAPGTGAEGASGGNAETTPSSNQGSTGGTPSGSTGGGGQATPSQPAAPQTLTCTVGIECSVILSNMDKLAPAKHSVVPSSGVILGGRTIEFTQGETVADVSKRAARNNGIQMSYSGGYVSGINNLYEFDLGGTSGWKYSVNGSYPSTSSNSITVNQGDRIQWSYVLSA